MLTFLLGEPWLSLVGDSGIVASPGSWLTRLVILSPKLADNAACEEEDKKSSALFKTSSSVQKRVVVEKVK